MLPVLNELIMFNINLISVSIIIVMIIIFIFNYFLHICNDYNKITIKYNIHCVHSFAYLFSFQNVSLH